MTTYEDFLRAKDLRVPPTGIPDARVEATWMFPHQNALTGWALRRGRSATFADTGLGKALAADAPVLTSRGWVAIGALSVGDMAIGSDGMPHPVTGVFPQGARDLFKVTFSDGAETVCDVEHLWAVNTKMRRSRKMPLRVMTLSAILEEGLRDQGGWRHFVPIVAPVQTAEAALPIDPYTLGVLIGDGGLTHGTPAVSTDDEMVAALMLPEGVRARRGERHGTVHTWSLTADAKGTGHHNPLTIALSGLGLWNRHSYEKFIPECYKGASVEQRRAILSGLLDTDGTATKNKRGACNVEYCTTSKTLADDVVYLVRSLGGITSVYVKHEPKYKYRGETRVGRAAYRVYIKMPGGLCPFRLSRKAAAWSPRTKYQPSRAIVAVEPAGRGEAVCISVDSPDRLFVTKDFVITHNTRMQLAWADAVAKHLNAPVLILTPLAVTSDFVREGQRIGVEVVYAREPGAAGRLTVTNYDMLAKFNPAKFGGVALDESSVLKDETSARRNELIEAFASTPFRSCYTATPSPNDHTELGNHAEFLGIMRRVEMLAKFFVHDGGSTQNWDLKGHAREAFWRWVCSWAALVKSPADLGFDASAYDLPPLVMHDHVVAGTREQAKAQGKLFAESATTLNEQRAARKATMNDRVKIAADLILAESDEPWVIWCELNAEAEALAKACGERGVNVYGSMKPDEKEWALAGFSASPRRHDYMITKPKIAGFGLNWQHCARVAFVGVSHSFEQWYQAIRRCWRFGQTRPVHCHVITSELEGAVLENLRRKEADARVLAEEMRRYTAAIVQENVRGATRESDAYEPKVEMSIPAWMRSDRSAA